MTPPLRSPWLPLPTIPRTFRSLSVGVDSRFLFLSILWSPLCGTLCERGENDHDEGPKDVSPRSRDGTRHADLPDLMHASLLTDFCLSFTLVRTCHSSNFRERLSCAFEEVRKPRRETPGWPRMSMNGLWRKKGDARDNVHSGDTNAEMYRDAILLSSRDHADSFDTMQCTLRILSHPCVIHPLAFAARWQHRGAYMKYDAPMYEN